MTPPSGFDWRTIAALNSVSTLAQIGQFGIAYVVLPVWLAAQGLDATRLGLFAASLWVGQLPGLTLAPWLCRQWGARNVILAGLLCTVAALLWIASATWPLWLPAGALAGLGLGLRWIGLEPWMYRIAPAHARGRLVGFHETLIGLAPIVAPLLAGYAGMDGSAVFWIGSAFALSALLPLALARAEAAPSADPALATTQPGARPPRDRIFKLGAAIALVGGMMEAAVSGLFALFAQGKGVTITQTADLLAVFGVGGLLLQYGVGWLADHRGLAYTGLCCALGTVAVSLAMALPLAYPALVVAVFLLGGFITAFLTLALVAGTTSRSGSMAGNVSAMSLLYTASAVLGPLLAGVAMEFAGSGALIGFIAATALAMATILYGMPAD